MAKAILKSDLISQIFEIVATQLYAEGIPEDEYAIWQEVDKNFEGATTNDYQSAKQAIAELSSKIPNFPEFGIEEDDTATEQPVEQPVEQTAEEDFSQFEHKVAEQPVIENEEEYQVSVFMQDKSYFADSSLVPTKDMYVRKSTEEEKSASAPIASEEDIKQMTALWGIQKFIKFENIDKYDWAQTDGEHTLSVRVKNGLIFFVGAQVGKVIDDKPVLSTTSIAAKFFKVQTISVQDAKVDGQDLAIISRKELMKVTERSMDLEKKLITVVSRLGLSLDLPADIMANEAAKVISNYADEARDKGNKLAVEKATVRQLEARVRQLQEELSSRSFVQPTQTSSAIDLESTPKYIAYFMSKDGQRKYLMLSEAKGKLVEKCTTNFDKAAKLSKQEILKHVIAVGSKHRISFTIAKLMIEIQ